MLHNSSLARFKGISMWEILLLPIIYPALTACKLRGPSNWMYNRRNPASSTFLSRLDVFMTRNERHAQKISGERLKAEYLSVCEKCRSHGQDNERHVHCLMWYQSATLQDFPSNPRGDPTGPKDLSLSLITCHHFPRPTNDIIIIIIKRENVEGNFWASFQVLGNQITRSHQHTVPIGED